MKLEDVQKRNNKDIVITIRTTKQNLDFIKANNISPARLFHKAIEELQKSIAEAGLKKLATWKGK